MKAISICAFGLALGLAISARADDRFDPPVPVRTTAPAYPAQLRHDGITGLVLVNCLIDEHGDVQEMNVERASNVAFIEPAMTALRKWKFKPAERDGNRLSVRVFIPIKFTIED